MARTSSASRAAVAAVLLLGVATESAGAQSASLQLDPQQTTVRFTLSDVIHTVRGTFRVERGSLTLDPVTGAFHGEIVVDAASGQSGNGMRDRKMHREVLESERFPEIVFRPDHLEGTVPPEGRSTVRVHGIFNIHGTEHELTIPAQVATFPDHWTAALHFSIPYVKWGMKNPSTLFLRVSESVDIDMNATGTIKR